MTRNERVKSLLIDVLDLRPEERSAYLDSRAENSAIRSEVLDLLSAHQEAGEFMSNPNDRLTDRHADGAQIGRYRIVELIGEGGFGRVYLAEQREPVVRQVALKIIKLGMDTRRVIARFEAERQALAMMEHPSIARVIDGGTTAQGRPYFVMELVRGVPITEYCEQHDLSIAQRLNLFSQVCSAIQHAHMKGIIHRDLKPSNVLITDHGGEPLPKVIDFGIAKATGGQLTDHTVFTEARQLIGTPEYMSPEQAQSDAADIDTRADVYSLGVLLYQLLTGTTPHDSKRMRSASFAELQRIIREEEPEKPSTRVARRLETWDLRLGEKRLETGNAGPEEGGSGLTSSHKPQASSLLSSSKPQAPNRKPLTARHLRGDLDWITLKALEKDRERRYASAAELAEDIRRHVQNRPVLAGPPGLGYRLQKLFKRRRIEVIAALVVGVAVIGGIIGTSVGMFRAQQSAVEARDSASQASAVYEFMRDVLTSVEPDEKGADVRLVEVMDDASAVASQRFAQHPVQEGLVRVMLGQVYTQIDRQVAASQQYAKAIDRFATALGPDDPRLLYARMHHGRSLLNQARPREAERALDGLSSRMTDLFGPDDLMTLECKAMDSGVLYRIGQADQAYEILRDVRARVERLLAQCGQDSPGTGQPLAGSGHESARGDPLNDAIRPAHSMLRSQAEPARVDTAERLLIVVLNSTENVLASQLGVSRVRDRVLAAEIEQVALEMARRCERVLGPDSLQTLRSRLLAAGMMVRLGRCAEAADICRQVLALNSSERVGACHNQRVLAMETLADALIHMGDAAQAADVTLATIDCTRQRTGVNPVVLLGKLSEALPVMARADRAAEGEAMAREFIEGMRTFGSVHGESVFNAELYIARFASMQGRLDEAAENLTALEGRLIETDGHPYMTARFHMFVALNLIQQRHFEQAENRLSMATDLRGDPRFGTEQKDPGDLLRAHATLYDAWGRPELAAEWREKQPLSINEDLATADAE